jgi:organic radical activating enzyme
MFGQNLIRPPVQGDGSRLEVKHVFPTLQGEGPFVGQPSVFVRLAGCNLACHFCDTEFEDGREMALAEILEDVTRLASDANGMRVRDLVVITGGEPFRQPIGPLCSALLDAGFRVQIETNGTIFRPVDDRVHIICSPKNTGQGYMPVRPDMDARVSAYKFLLSTRDDRYQQVPPVRTDVPVYVQPMDEYDAEANAANLAFAARMAQERGFRLSLQMHKMLGIE